MVLYICDGPYNELKLPQVVDETDRLLREAYQSWLPTVLELAYSSSQSQFPFANNINPPSFGFGSLRTIRSS